MKKYKPTLRTWPVYFKSVLKLGNLQSNIGIATLWTPLDLICQGLLKNSYAVAGQLYSQAGVNFILRNVLANPGIRYLVVCGEEHPRERSGQALINFVKKGLDKKNQIIGTKNGFIDKEIPPGATEKFREKVKIFDLRGIHDPRKIQKTIGKLPTLESFSSPCLYPNPSAPEGDFPFDRTPEKIKAKTIAQAWVKILQYVMKFGNEEMTNYGTLAREVPNLIAVVTDEDPSHPKLEPYLKLSHQDILSYIKTEFFSPKIGGEKYYSYGERLRAMPPKKNNQIKIIVGKLKKDFNDRGAIAVLWDVEKDNKILRNPCLVLVQGKLIRGTLDLTAYFRSNDMFGAWPLNAFGLRSLQYEIAKKLKAKIGILTTISNCAHIYQERFEEAQEIVKKYGKRLFCEWDPRGNFVIKIEKGNIKALHFSPDGSRLLEEFAGKTAKEVFDQIERVFGISQTAHAFYLGAELEKAELVLKLSARVEEAIKLGLKFEQDKILKE